MKIPRLLQKFLCGLLILSIVAGSSCFSTKEAFAKGRKTITYEGENFKVDFQVTSQWTGAFNANVKITNTGDSVIDNWAIGFSSGFQISNLWNGKIESHDQSLYVIKNVKSNQDINENGSINFGFTAKTEGEPVLPQSFFLLGTKTEVEKNNYSVDYKISNDWKDAFNGEIVINNTSDQDIEDWILEFDYPYEINRFWTAQIISKEGNHYCVKNAGYNADIISGKGFSLGFSANTGNTSVSPENITLSQITTDKYQLSGDSDSDRLCNETELIYGTNPYKQDTDGDQLSDLYEVYCLGTDPLKKDSNENGIEDGDEDYDGDGLTVLEEIRYQTEENNPDTDSDGLSDGEEVNKYHTDSILADSDKDNISDGDEIKLGLNPNSPVTSEIPDNQICTSQVLLPVAEEFSEINTQENAYDVSVDCNVAGLLKGNLKVTESGYANAIQSDAVLGIIPELDYIDGLKVDTVRLNFKLHKEVLDTVSDDGQELPEELQGIKRYHIFKFFEDDGLLLPIETQYDVANDTLYTEVDEFGTYCIFNLVKWFELIGATDEDVTEELQEEPLMAANFMAVPDTEDVLQDEDYIAYENQKYQDVMRMLDEQAQQESASEIGAVVSDQVVSLPDEEKQTVENEIISENKRDSEEKTQGQPFTEASEEAVSNETVNSQEEVTKENTNLAADMNKEENQADEKDVQQVIDTDTAKEDQDEELMEANFPSGYALYSNSSNPKVSNTSLEFYTAVNGWFSVGTTIGNPKLSTDNYKNLLFGGTSRTTIRINGMSHTFSASSVKIDTKGLSSTSEMTKEGIETKQELKLVEGSTTGTKDVLRIKYTVKNTSKEQKTVGSRIMLDTMLGNNDFAPFRVMGKDLVTEKEYNGSEIPQVWYVFDSLKEPGIIAQGTLYQTASAKPDKVQFINYARTAFTRWNAPISPGWEIGDSSVTMTWNEKKLDPGETREYVTYYGISDILMNRVGGLYFGATLSRDQIEKENNEFSEVTLSSFIQNAGSHPVSNIKVTLDVPQELCLKGQKNEVHYDALSPGQQVSISFPLCVKDEYYNTHNKDIDVTVHLSYYDGGLKEQTIAKKLKIVNTPLTILSATGLEKITLKRPLKVRSKTNSDTDDLPDIDEVNLSYPLVKENEDGSLKLPTLYQCMMRMGDKPYVEEALDLMFEFQMSEVFILPIRSDPTQEDTDRDGYWDDEEIKPLEWNKYNMNSYEIDQKYYINKVNGKKYLAPEAQDFDILSAKDKELMVALLDAYVYYFVKRTNKYGVDSNPCLNEVLLSNEMGKIRRKNEYCGKYEFSDRMGVCFGPLEGTPNGTTVYIECTKITKLDILCYKGVIIDTISTALTIMSPTECKALSALLTFVGVGLDNQLSGTDIPWLSTLKIKKPLKALLAGVVLSAVDFAQKQSYKEGDSSYRLCIHRGGTGGLVKQSVYTVAINENNLPCILDRAEYGYEDELEPYVYVDELKLIGQ